MAIETQNILLNSFYFYIGTSVHFHQNLICNHLTCCIIVKTM